jgi:hypothetical protein
MSNRISFGNLDISKKLSSSIEFKMVALKDVITQELETLKEEQLRQIADFIAFLKFRT